MVTCTNTTSVYSKLQCQGFFFPFVLFYLDTVCDSVLVCMDQNASFFDYLFVCIFVVI